VGTHQNYNSVHILNGLGTRGVMLGPAMAKALYENIEYQVPLNTEIDIKDFCPKKNYRVILYLGHRKQTC
jgi:hypothetical protein